ncbi:MAG: hypothetical protein OXP71_16945 [Candidatus Poribacteria bacterium]|nr:hypothetical protein [Candidatus Poribacteria bacterium]
MGNTIVFAYRSVDAIQRDSTKYVAPALSGARCPAYKAYWGTRGKEDLYRTPYSAA